MVNALCKVCNKASPAEKFRLHHTYKLVVCPTCFSGRTEELRKKEQQLKVEPAKPAGWDQDDEYLEKMSVLRKQEQQASFTKVPGTSQVRCTCAHCKYQFRYDPFRKLPKTCPYCDKDVPKTNTYSML
tara:strand:- start:19403 stop:19786 length:384 start_codon:yes stop_codon:yes gene_type:complete